MTITTTTNVTASWQAPCAMAFASAAITATGIFVMAQTSPPAVLAALLPLFYFCWGQPFVAFAVIALRRIGPLGGAAPHENEVQAYLGVAFQILSIVMTAVLWGDTSWVVANAVCWVFMVLPAIFVSVWLSASCIRWTLSSLQRHS